MELILVLNFHHLTLLWEKNFIIFGADMSSSVHIGNKGKYILILDEGPTQRLDDTKLTEEPKYPINFTKSGKRFVLSLHYNGSNSCLFVNDLDIYQFKAKIYEVKDYVLCLGNISIDFTVDILKKKKNRIKRSRKIFFY